MQQVNTVILFDKVGLSNLKQTACFNVFIKNMALSGLSNEKIISDK